MGKDTNSNSPGGNRGIEAVRSICGCGGKTSLEEVVYPARRKLGERLRQVGVELGDNGDVAILPLTDDCRRAVETIEADSIASHDPLEIDGPVWTLTATLADTDLGGSEQQFVETIGEIYESLGKIGSVTIGKGHSVQLNKASKTVQWFEHFEPVGPKREGHIVANIDIIHAFPDLSVREQAAIASYHTLNDCYSAGGHDGRTVRPIVVVTTGNDVTPEEVDEWYRSVLPDDISLLPGVVLEHDGYGWLFGATATARIPHDPPTFEREITSGDQVLLHRSLGGLAMYTVGIESSDAELKDAARRELIADHHPVAEVIAQYCPGPDESFDPSKHIKYSSDVSGPGIRDLEKPSEKRDLAFNITDIPILSETIADHVHAHWTVPDVTVETNGPIAVVARPTVIRDIEADLLAVSQADPVVVGEYSNSDRGTTLVTQDVEIERYLESLS
ncbi:hypothetical protein NGM10_17590 (plasmid) [Halorussus salilacus]|uniref:hypothetical protein n=1 Tax=Halorussus salilacus TaxID=2953750 RepID=UPI00209F52C8|nr:hypothetical protein [Halorussus salilacus]USZ70014.1 hypothetical protein NGM10_17590 [Halorussus salilacus]